MKDLLLTLPLLLPLLGGLLSFFLRRSPAGEGVAVASALAQVGVAAYLLGRVGEEGIQSTALGSWPAPFGIVLVVDTLSALMVFITALLALAITLYSLHGIDPQRKALGYFAFFQFLVLGIQGAFLTGDLFNLYVWLEVMLLASFVLLTLGGERAQLLGGFKYFALNFLSSLFYLVAVGLTYGLTGTLNMADLHLRLREATSQELHLLAGFLLLSLGIKAALFPFFFWLPAAYPTPPLPLAAFFGALPTKVAVYALFRLFTLLFPGEAEAWRGPMLWLAGFTMVTGVLGALAQMEVRRLLAFHSVSQIGYMIMGLALLTPLGLAAGIFYTVQYVFIKAALFLVAGLAQRLLGSFFLGELGGVYARRPFFALLFLVPALSLAGLPPFSGFFAKLFLVVGGLEIGEYAIVATALLVGLFTLMSMMKIWREAFWKPLPEERARLLEGPVPSTMVLGTALLSFLTVFIGFGAGYGFALAEQAARELLDPSAYVAAVLGGAR